MHEIIKGRQTPGKKHSSFFLSPARALCRSGLGRPVRREGSGGSAVGGSSGTGAGDGERPLQPCGRRAGPDGTPQASPGGSGSRGVERSPISVGALQRLSPSLPLRISRCLPFLPLSELPSLPFLLLLTRPPPRAPPPAPTCPPPPPSSSSLRTPHPHPRSALVSD